MPQFIQDVINLAQQATLWLLALVPVTGGLFFLYFSWKKSVTEDEGMLEKLNRNIKNTLIYSAVCFGASGIVTTILSFF